MKKVLLITNIIPPYRVPLYNYVSVNSSFDFRVLVLGEKEKNRKWEFKKNNFRFNYRVLSGWYLFFFTKNKEISIHLNKGVFSFLKRYKPDIVITSGYDSLAYWQAFIYCKIFKKKYILWNGTTLLSADKIRGFWNFLKKIIIKGADKYIAYGTKAKDYLIYFGAREKDIYISLNTVDVEFFNKGVAKYLKSSEFLATRRNYPKFLLLYTGQLVRRKGVFQILEALNILNDSDIGFMIVGSGPEEKRIKKFCTNNNLKNVFLEGSRQQEELIKYYALADAFILPSLREVWGLVVNEALASGLFVLCSKYAGAAFDIITKENGIIFDPKDINKTAELINYVKNQLNIIRYKRYMIANWARKNLTIKKSGEAFIQVINSLN